jgi:hypothetical protein
MKKIILSLIAMGCMIILTGIYSSAISSDLSPTIIFGGLLKVEPSNGPYVTIHCPKNKPYTFVTHSFLTGNSTGFDAIRFYCSSINKPPEGFSK